MNHSSHFPLCYNLGLCFQPFSNQRRGTLSWLQKWYPQPQSSRGNHVRDVSGETWECGLVRVEAKSIWLETRYRCGEGTCKERKVKSKFTFWSGAVEPFWGKSPDHDHLWCVLVQSSKQFWSTLTRLMPLLQAGISWARGPNGNMRLNQRQLWPICGVRDLDQSFGNRPKYVHQTNDGVDVRASAPMFEFMDSLLLPWSNLNFTLEKRNMVWL